jgi:GTP cyclohydrolase IB
MADFPDALSRPPLPDVVAELRPALGGALDWVGMQGIDLPLLAAGPGAPLAVMAKVSAWVNLLGGERRGIHMSRLYRSLQDRLAAQQPDRARLQQVLQEFLDSHAGLSDRARLTLDFSLPVQRTALRSGLAGWRAYPVRISAVLAQGRLATEVQVDVEYSSTCPGSAALARQLIQQRFAADFPQGDPPRAALYDWLGSPAGICATPHAQRSSARVQVRLGMEAEHDAPVLIDRIEQALATPVQTAVRREDEQAFALLNGENPMYCEDAVRRIRAALEALPSIADYAIRAAHLESLHPHDAVASAVRGVPGGFAASTD